MRGKRSQASKAPSENGERGPRAGWAGRLRRTTMLDVANEARVSQTTVSLVLNHADGARLSAQTRLRVINAAAKLGYRPAGRGGGSGSSRPQAIAFVCDEISTDPWTSIGFDGVREKAWERGFTVSVMATRGDAEMERAAFAQLASQSLSGSDLLDHQHASDRSACGASANADRPAELPRRQRGACRRWCPARLAGGHAATDFLLRAGHRRIGYINGEPSMEASRHRLKGYRQALATADLPFDPELVRDGNWQPLSGYEGAPTR